MLLDLLKRAGVSRSRRGFLLDLGAAGWRFMGPPPVVVVVPPPAGVPFPPQISGLRIKQVGAIIELCMVALADAPAGMGGQLRLRKNGVTYAVYLVETSDTFASPVRIQTATGIKAIRLKT